jgi:trans-2,3-dihydro-3-hydroxyanthranilate isomerase
MAHPFHIVDVFAEQPLAGNPLAVVTHAEGMDSGHMQRVAAEINFSETTFVGRAPEADGGWRMRLFTPARELDFAGHPILGTAWVIRRHLAPQAGAALKLHLPVGPISVQFETGADGETLWFQAPPMTPGPHCPRAAVAAALGLTEDDIADHSPVQKMTAGISTLLVPLRGVDALRRARLNLDAYAPLLAQGFPPLLYLFSRETRAPGCDLAVRFFFEAHGVREDPATGNGAAFLGAYLLEHGGYGQSLSLRLEQGQELRRPSVVRLRARQSAAGREVFVGGGVLPVVRGELL